jgi:LssY C-terminus
MLLLPQGLFAEEGSTGAARLDIPDGTPVHLRLTQTVSSLHARVGDRLAFAVENDVRVGGYTVIHAGSAAQGSIVRVKGRRVFGVGGKVVFGLDFVTLANGEMVGLSGRKVITGRSHAGRMLAGMAVAALFYLPAAPLFLLTRGGTSTVLTGTEVTGHIDCDSSVATTDLPRAAESVAGLNDMMENMAPRVLDGEGREGDMVNLIFVARKEDLQGAFAHAGWIKTDPWRPVMAWHLLLHRTHDAKLPMARFYLFGRQQDYSYALPDPDAVVSRRHHIRIWQTGYTVEGMPIWVGAATHDVAITFAMRGKIINHMIDPQVDTERDFVGTNLAEAAPIHEEYLQSEAPVFEAKTSSGEAYHSDSRILLLDFHQPVVADAVLVGPVSGVGLR